MKKELKECAGRISTTADGISTLLNKDFMPLNEKRLLAIALADIKSQVRELKSLAAPARKKSK